MATAKFNVQLGMGGRYKAEVYDAQGNLKRESEWTDNLITNSAFNNWFDTTSVVGFSLSYCQVGTDNTTPDPSDTQLGSMIAETASANTASFSQQTSVAPFYTQVERTWTFGLGDVVGNISEVGIRSGSGTGGYLVSRALFLDGMGSPTTITVLADEQLRITYQMRCQFPDQDIVTTVDGYSVTLRACEVDDSNYWNPTVSWRFSPSNNSIAGRAYTGVIGSITGNPSGTSYSSSSFSSSTYVADSLTRTSTVIWDITTANDSLQSFDMYAGHRWQFQVSPTVDKTADDQLTIELTTSAARV